MDACGITDRGKRRCTNQDRILVNSEMGLFVVADGMGGHALGEVASEKAVISVNKYICCLMKNPSFFADADMLCSEVVTPCNGETKTIAYVGTNRIGGPPQEDVRLKGLVEQALFNAHSEIYKYSLGAAKDDIMGTTLSLLLLHNGAAYVSHIGDSRIYLFRNGTCTKLTRDHTHAQELVDVGLISTSEAENHKTSHILTQALGARPTIRPDIVSLAYEPNDVFFLSSDGLFRILAFEEVACILLGKETAQRKCEILLHKALEGGAPDNVSVIVIQ